LPTETPKPFTGYLWGALAVLTCPCHLPILAVVLAGTTAGAFIGEHWGHRGARFDRPVPSVPVAGVAGIQGKRMSAFRPDGWTTPELAQAVERGQLELHYQPVVDLRSGGIVGAEALLRWRHPTLGLLPPGQFLPVVESSGLMPEIGAWVLGEACRQMRDWRMLAWRPFRLAVNVSASQVGPDFDGWVKGVLADAELPAEYLEIELTESVAFGDPAIFPALDALRQIGVRFAADDFGTGYSCLQHLKCCPISTLKIDQSFVAGLANDRRDQTIVHTVIQLAHGLGMEVVAEGVETSASLAWLRQADCDTGQGFLFAKPMPAAAFAVFVSQWRVPP
jgi:EAL domain-containing protein (putative c-di-GMP-specific phosphodiesterase class I)